MISIPWHVQVHVGIGFLGHFFHVLVVCLFCCNTHQFSTYLPLLEKKSNKHLRCITILIRSLFLSTGTLEYRRTIEKRSDFTPPKNVKCNQPGLNSCWFDPRRTFVLNAIFGLWSCGHPVTGSVIRWLTAVESVFGNSDTFLLWYLFCSKTRFNFHFSNNFLTPADFCLICCSGSTSCCLVACSLSLLWPNLPVLVLFSSPREETSLCTVTVSTPVYLI